MVLLPELVDLVSSLLTQCRYLHRYQLSESLIPRVLAQNAYRRILITCQRGGSGSREDSEFATRQSASHLNTGNTRVSSAKQGMGGEHFSRDKGEELAANPRRVRRLLILRADTTGVRQREIQQKFHRRCRTPPLSRGLQPLPCLTMRHARSGPGKSRNQASESVYLTRPPEPRL